MRCPGHASVPQLATMLDSVQRELVRRAAHGNGLAVSVLDVAATAARKRANEAGRIVERLRSPDVPPPRRAPRGDFKRVWRDEERRVLDALEAHPDPATARQVAPLVGLDVERVRVVLTRLRKHGKVHHCGSGHWQVVVPPEAAEAEA